MNLRFGLREVDISRRENGVVSWLGSRSNMPGKEFADLFSEWTSGPYLYSARMLTQLALDNLVDRGIVCEAEIRVGGIGSKAFNLADKSIADTLDANAVELAPREVVLLGFMGIRPSEPHSADVLDERMGEQIGPDSWRTEACLAHLAKLGLLNVLEDPCGAYQLP